VAGTGQAYVYLAEGHAQVTRPLVVIEGFDIDDSYHWEELYELLNQQGLLETLRDDGFDAIVLDFDSATAAIQRNGLLAAELIAQVASMIDPSVDFSVIGASMGGLVARYALCWMESQAIDTRTSSLLCFDVPHAGANIPLGIQHWVTFFADLSTEAQFLLDRVNSDAARQMLVYHHTATTTTGNPDPKRASFLADLAALGDWPSGPRLVAVANGASDGTTQGFAPAQQIVSYEYESFLLDITGNVWALPQGTNTKIFDGGLDYFLLPDENLEVFVSGTSPYDGAPGGRRDSMAQMDAVAAPFGDIVALHDDHCFIPTISALALPTTDPFFDVDGQPDLLALTPFDALFVPASPNEEHVEVTAQTAQWILDEIRSGTATGTDGIALASTDGLVLLPAAPHPARSATTLRFTISERSHTTVALYDVRGRRVDVLLDRTLDAGAHTVQWARPPSLAGGVYFWEVRTSGARGAQRVVWTD